MREGVRERGATVLFAVLLSLCVTFLGVCGQALAAGPAVQNVRIGTFEDYTRVVLRTNAPVSPRLFTLAEPDRLVIDLPEIGWEIPQPNGRVDSRLINEFRFGLFEPGVSRLIFSLSGPAKVETVESRSGEDGLSFEYDVRLTELDLPEAMPEPVIAGVPLLSSLEPRSARRTSEARRAALPEAPLIDREKRKTFRALSFDPGEAEFGALGDLLARLEGGEEAPAEAEPVAPAPKLAERPEARAETVSKGDKRDVMAKAALAGVPKVIPRKRAKPVVIVLDPGHGGRDPGTAARDVGLDEKEVVLDFSETLYALLDADPNYEVHATRRTDTFVRLPKRVAYAREQNADLMISIHADWFKDASIKGATAYTLSEEASMRSAEQIVSGDDAPQSVAGIAIDHEREDVVRLLLDLTRRETQTQSQRFAELVVDALEEVTPVVRGVRHNDLHVLRTPDLPAVLIELGYMSNAEDRELMQSDAWLNKTAVTVKKALDAWRAERGVREFARR